MATSFPLPKTVPNSPSLGKALADTSPALKFAAAGSALASMGAAKTVDGPASPTIRPSARHNAHDVHRPLPLLGLT